MSHRRGRHVAASKLKVPSWNSACNFANAWEGQFKSGARVAKEVQDGLKQRRGYLMSLPTDTRRAFSSIAASSGALPDDNMGFLTSEDHWHDEIDHDISHEGGEYEDAVSCALQFAAQSK
ncbi:hypothetical protein DEU56DRAFT_906203 [Suillus clintonianus]|uniref:uncharacterized protein n=1 Tax=Suillus clintonianus TaxID=1904413 RepID=UPI001B8713DF|nr:uncharacterized protein DEU56DRAFT_906203 [Suillus clintonianus]KAG2156021.1 hypothetical protein DEU56DRAFT_906203 [Suillus clintonianus]